MNFPWGMAKFPREKSTFPGEQCTFPEERPKFPKKTYVLNLFAIIVISYFYIWFYNLSLEMFQKELQLCSQKHFIHNSYAKATIKQHFGHICSLRKHMFQIFLQSRSSHFFYIGLQLIIGKVLRRVTNLQLETLQSKLICKSYDHTKFQTHLLLGTTWLFPQDNLSLILFRGQPCAREQFKENNLNHVPMRNKCV